MRVSLEKYVGKICSSVGECRDIVYPRFEGKKIFVLIIEILEFHRMSLYKFKFEKSV